MHSGLPAFSPQGHRVSILFTFLRHRQIRPYLDSKENARKGLTCTKRLAYAKRLVLISMGGLDEKSAEFTTDGIESR